MDFRERILTTISHREPNRIPTMGLIMDPATSSAILGKKTTDLVSMLRKPVMGSLIKSVMNSNKIWSQFFTNNFRDALESSIKLGFDANWIIYAQMKLVRDKTTKLGWVWHDLFGRIYEIQSDAVGNISANYTRPLCPTEEKWDAWVKKHESDYNQYLENATNFFKTLTSQYQDRIYPMCYAAPGPWENCWQPIGFANFFRYVRQKPSFIKRVIEFYTDFYLKNLDAVCAANTEVVFGGDDWGYKTGLLMNPKMVEELFGETYRKISRKVHSQNKKFIFHSCGNIYELLDKFVEWGFDGIITMEPLASMNLGKVRNQVGHKLILIGNLDVSYLLVQGSKEEIRQAVKQAVEDAAQGGGFILSAAHSHSKVDPIRLQWMLDAAKELNPYKT